jgi:hypothetical protein
MKFNETKTRATSKDLERKSFGSSRLSVLNEDRSRNNISICNSITPL